MEKPLSQVVEKRLADDEDVTVRGITSDSRDVSAGDLFVACAGTVHDGHDFVADAVERGAVAICSERSVDVAVPNVVVGDLKRRQGELAAAFYDDPSARLGCIGVTGTNGKTSIAYFTAALIETGAFIGTIGWGSADKLCPSRLTTEDPITIQARLHALAERGHRWVVMEASSHALDQGRVDAVRFDIAIFSNLTRDHLDYHGTMQRYAAAKRSLFERKSLNAAVINVDDALGREIAASLDAGVDRIGVGADGDVSWSDVRYLEDGVSGTLTTPWGSAEFRIPVYGDFSIANVAAAVAASCLAGTSLGDAMNKITRLPHVPGRMQRVSGTHGPLLLVDYAHTPDALAAVLKAIRQHLTGTLICVFGCGGDRDRGKRALMAQAVEAGADRAIVTSDNPRSEDPEAIIRDVLKGFSSTYVRTEAVETEVDRASAIARAIATAGDNDIVLVAGKGHEGYQEIAGRRYPYSDLVTARQLLGGTE